MKKITILLILSVFIILIGFNVTACSRTPQSSAEAGAVSTGTVVAGTETSGAVTTDGAAAGGPDIAISARPSQPAVRAGLYADDNPITSVPANNLKAAFDYANANPGPAENPTKYILQIDQDISSGVLFLGAPPAADQPFADLTIIGIGGERTIQYNGPAIGSLFFIGDTISGLRGRLTLGNNITLKGIQTGEEPLVNVIFGSLTMEAGSKITGHKTSNIGGAVSVYNTFVMNGGEISGNESTYMHSAGAVFVSVAATQGNFTMNGGTITGNTGGFGSAVIVDGNEWEGAAVFTMNGGTITGNTSLGEVSMPMDVWVRRGASFTRTGGTIGALEDHNNY